MDKKKRLLILIFVLILSGIVVIFIHKNGSMKGDSIMAVSYTHLTLPTT